MTHRTAPPPADSLADPLAATLARLAPGHDAGLVARTVRLLCAELELGHVCVALRDWQQRALDPDPLPFPALAGWRAALRDTGLCEPAADGTPRPLVLDDQDRLYLRRHHAAEQQIVRFVRERLQRPPGLAAAALRATLHELALLPAPGRAAPDWQLAAIAAAARSPFAVLTGGPGTGKTTTVAALLAVLLHRAPDLQVALAAPTGKAAARLGEALHERAQRFPHLAAGLARLRPKTLHRLLGYLPLEDAFRAGPDRPLRCDLVVVDEASMVDPALLAALCRALRPATALLLVGDRDQLAAVAAGQVLGDLCRLAAPERGAGAGLAAFAAAAADLALPIRPDAPALADCVVALRENHRFGAQPGIGGFARALAARDPTAALGALAAGHADLQHVTGAPDALAPLADPLHAATTAGSALDALRLLASCRVLCAARHGPSGTAAWNARVEALLATRGVRVDDRWYRGRPVLVTANDHQNELWNGDLGVIWPGPDGRPHAVFPRPGGGERWFAVQRLPAHETAWAITVHKAQGSEFDTVLLVMPDQPGPLWQAPLLYTGITRARRRALLLADPALLAPALAHWPNRSSGLADGLLDAASSASGASTGP